jgi:hypothetical protein
MRRIKQLLKRRKQILQWIGQIVEMRRGSVVRQMIPRKKQGQPDPEPRGPYPLFSFKRKGKTVSRRLHSEEERKRLEGQVQNFHRFQELSRQLVETAEALAEEKEKKS